VGPDPDTHLRIRIRSQQENDSIQNKTNATVIMRAGRWAIRGVREYRNEKKPQYVFLIYRLPKSKAVMKYLGHWVPLGPIDPLQWDGLIEGNSPLPWTPINRRGTNWRLLLRTLEKDEEFPMDLNDYTADLLFSPRNKKHCLQRKCGIGFTIWVRYPTPFPVHVAHNLSAYRPSTSPQMLFKARSFFTLPLTLSPGFNTIAWSGHFPIFFQVGIRTERDPTICFPGKPGSSLTTFSYTDLGGYSINPSLAPSPALHMYDVQGGISPLHISVYLPEGGRPPLQVLSLLAQGGAPFHNPNIYQAVSLPSEHTNHTRHWLYSVNHMPILDSEGATH
jgi:hypothetical protein